MDHWYSAAVTESTISSPFSRLHIQTWYQKSETYHESRLSIIVRQYQYNSRECSHSKSIAEYVAVLRKLTEFCNNEELFDEMLHDRFVCGIVHSVLQKHLIREPDLTFNKVVTVAQTAELAEKGAHFIQSLVDTEPKEVHKFSTTNAKLHSATENKNSSSSDKSTRVNCCQSGRGGEEHNQQTCQFNTETCHFAINMVTLLKLASARNVNYHR